MVANVIQATWDLNGRKAEYYFCGHCDHMIAPLLTAEHRLREMRTCRHCGSVLLWGDIKQRKG